MSEKLAVIIGPVNCSQLEHSAFIYVNEKPVGCIVGAGKDQSLYLNDHFERVDPPGKSYSCSVEISEEDICKIRELFEKREKDALHAPIIDSVPILNPCSYTFNENKKYNNQPWKRRGKNIKK